MKKKLSIIPLLVVALTMMFGTLCVWADPSTITKVVINLPNSCDERDVKDFIERDISVFVYENDDSPMPITTKTLQYRDGDDGQSYISTDNGSLYPGMTMEKGKRYEFNLRITLADSEKDYYDFAHNDDNSFNGNVSSPNKSIDVSTTLVPVDNRNVVDIKFYYTYGASSSSSPTPKKAVSLFPHEIYRPLVAVNEEKPVVVNVDRDTFKSEAPSKTVMAAETFGTKSFFDLKVHEADEKTIANQNFLAQTLAGSKEKIFLTENVYPRRDLSITENGSLQTLTWNNLPKNQPGPVCAVVYNQIDGAYVINGILDANGTATFTGFKLRPASTITICK